MSDEISVGHESIAPHDQSQLPTPRRRAPNYQIDALAKMASQGVTISDMSLRTGLDEDYIAKITAPGKHQGFEVLLEGYREKSQELTIHHHFKMVEFLPDVYIAIGAGLKSDDDNLKVNTAFKVIRELVAPPGTSTQVAEGGAAVQFNFGTNAQLYTQINETLTHVPQMLSEMREAIAGQVPNRYVHDGETALPSPVSTMPVSDGEALPPEQQFPDSSIPFEEKEESES